MNIGDKVRFLNATGGGIVRRIDEAHSLAYVEDEDGFEIPTVFSECVVIIAAGESTAAGASESDYTRRNMSLLSKGPSTAVAAAKAKADQPKPDRAANGKKEPQQIEQIEFDLHIEKLLPGRHDLRQDEILPYQLKMFRKTMRDNLRYRGRRIVFIHGHGEGILRRELTNILNHEFKSCRYMETAGQKYAGGALLVLIG